MADSLKKRPALFIVASEQDLEQHYEETARQLGAEVYHFVNVAELLRYKDWTHPCCLIIESPCAGECASSIQTKLAQGSYVPPTIVLTKTKDYYAAVRIMEQGAMTVLPKDDAQTSLLEKCEKALQWDLQTCRLLKTYESTGRTLDKLSERQRFVLDRVAQGKPTHAIAKELDVSVRLVESERSNILRVFDVASTPDVTLRIGEFRILDTIKGNGIPQNHLSFRISAARNGRLDADSS